MSLTTDPKLQEIRERRTEAETEWAPILAEARKDRLCVAGRVWEAMDPKGWQARTEKQRPAISLDELGQFINQTVNEVRANPRGIKFAPTGNGANDAGAEFYQNHTREVEYRSHAQIAYLNAFEQAVTSSIGWLRVRTKRAHPRTFDQDLWIDPIMNADQVLPSPGFVWPDGRDIKYLFYIEPWQERDFVRTFKDAEVKSFTPEWRSLASPWIQPHTVQVGEYWSIETTTRRLIAFQLPGHPETRMTVFVDELPDKKLPEGVENLREEDSEEQTVYSCLTNGVEILQENTWPGQHIPFVCCMGKTLYVESTSGSSRTVLSQTRLARNPAMLHAYIVSAEAETIGAVPRTQWVGYKGQFADPARWEKANYEPVAYTEALERTESTPPNAVLPLPQHQPWDPPVQNLELAKESARRSIQSAMAVTPLPTALQRDSQKSGEAYRRVEAAMQRGSYHFVAAHDLMIERTGMILEDLIDKVLDTPREVPVRKPDDSAAVVRINMPDDPESVSTQGTYRVTISTGPASDSQREEAADFVNAMVTNLAVVAQMAGPQVAMQVLAKSIKLKQLGPIGDEIVELLAPKQVGEDGKPLPPEVAKLLGENKQLKQLLQQAAQEKEAKVVEQQGKFAIVQHQEQAETARAHEANALEMAIAKMEDRIARLELTLKAHEGGAERTQEQVMAGMSHAQTMDASEAGVRGQMAVNAAKPKPNGGGA